MLICLTSLSGKAFSQSSGSNETTNPGIIESFERLLELHKEQFQKNKISIQSNLKAVSSLSGYEEVKLDPQYVKSLILHSDERFVKLALKDECRFLSMLETNLLKTTEGNIDNILINYKTKDGKIESATMLKDDFFDQIYKRKCLNNREYSILFTETNAQKTIEGIKFTVPKTKNECTAIHNEWLDNPYTPYLCRIQQVFKKPALRKIADYYRERIPLMQRIYLDNICNSISNPELFCNNYLKGDVWSKIITSEVPDYKMSYKCQQMYNKTTKLTVQEMRNCASKLATDNKFCETRGTQDFPSNFPLQNCNNISDALNKSKLVTDYQDCPGNIDNEALTNIHRLVNHFAPRKIITSKETCRGEANYTLARLNLDIKHESGWPLKVCYMNRVEGKETCDTYIPGARADEPLSEDQVVSKILYAQKGAPQKTTCKLVDAKNYNPLRSEFKFGCFIVFNPETCSTLACNKKVIWEEKEQKDIHFVGFPVFDYFPTAYISERYAFTSLINEVKGTQERIVRNLTDVKYWLDKMPNGVIHGIGCAEDLMPEQFQRTAINQCHPLPFIVDGHVEKDGESLLVARLSIDDIHTPRFLLWPNIFNAVSAYQELHPLNTWTLYGIKK
jgi:hypothetical protein